MIPMITMTVDEAEATLEATLARVCDDRQPVLLVEGSGRVPVAVLLDFETYEAVKAGRAGDGAADRWGPTNGPALSAA
jgi:PHD/YefM family antitoxin component YafN of YafNO toxin-antitoxin module